jgi:Rps23 Pro-64 3,4-dihydroxylase Tpa1-like proline 4-hydroxylase|tara:strand:+ start:448 stop:1050 length:603 start_codon:yes stop_codon:yes gene_type:complete
MDYILEIHDILPKEVCESIIERYKKDPKKEQSKIGVGGHIKENVRKSTVLPFSDNHEWRDVDNIIHDVISRSIKKYMKYITEIYSNTGLVDIKCIDNQITENFGKMEDEGYFIQEYKEGDFYEWHVDKNRGFKLSRVLSFVLYLNTLNENQGGCTEFINGKKVRPVQGKIVVFPSDWQYYHRGAPVENGGIKYTIGTWAV